jgi:hypothetical protein
MARAGWRGIRSGCCRLCGWLDAASRSEALVCIGASFCGITVYVMGRLYLLLVRCLRSLGRHPIMQGGCGRHPGRMAWSGAGWLPAGRCAWWSGIILYLELQAVVRLAALLAGRADPGRLRKLAKLQDVHTAQPPLAVNDAKAAGSSWHAAGLHARDTRHCSHSKVAPAVDQQAAMLLTCSLVWRAPTMPLAGCLSAGCCQATCIQSAETQHRVDAKRSHDRRAA